MALLLSCAKGPLLLPFPIMSMSNADDEDPALVVENALAAEAHADGELASPVPWPCAIGGVRPVEVCPPYEKIGGDSIKAEMDIGELELGWAIPI